MDTEIRYLRNFLNV